MRRELRFRFRGASRFPIRALRCGAEDCGRGSSAFAWVGLLVFDDVLEGGEGRCAGLGLAKSFTSCYERFESLEALGDIGSLEEVEDVERADVEVLGECDWVKVEADELGEDGVGVGLHGGHGTAGMV